MWFIARMAVALSLLLAVSVVYGQGKKKGKEPALAICKRGKLIFQDDFSGKELLWDFNANECEWKIVKGKLATNLKGENLTQIVSTKFSPSRDIIIEVRIFAPPQSFPLIMWNRHTTYPFCEFDTRGGNAANVSISTYSKETEYVNLAQTRIEYRRPRWVNVAFEVVGSRYAVTVEGKSITCELPDEDRPLASSISIWPKKFTTDILAIDDVMVYEALPKDEGDKDKEKDKKKK